jgi:hypothetical protein
MAEKIKLPKVLRERGWRLVHQDDNIVTLERLVGGRAHKESAVTFALAVAAAHHYDGRERQFESFMRSAGNVVSPRPSLGGSVEATSVKHEGEDPPGYPERSDMEAGRA